MRPRYMSTPFLKGSVLEDFIRTCMMVGFVWLSTAMSEKLRCAPESYFVGRNANLSCTQEAKEACGVCSPCHNVVKLLRLFVKKSFDLNEDRRGDREAGLCLPPLFGL